VIHKKSISNAEIPQENVYAVNNSAMSQVSALNKRKVPLPQELSRNSALNDRYTRAASQNLTSHEPEVVPVIVQSQQNKWLVGVNQPVTLLAANPGFKRPSKIQDNAAPGGVRDPVKKRTPVPACRSENMDSLMDTLFDGIDDEVKDLTDPYVMEGRIKGGGETVIQPQVSG